MQFGLRWSMVLLIVGAVSTVAVCRWRFRDWRRGADHADQLWREGFPCWRWTGSEWTLTEVEPPFPTDQPDFQAGFIARLNALESTRRKPAEPRADVLEDGYEVLKELSAPKAIAARRRSFVVLHGNCATVQWPSGEFVGLWADAHSVSVVSRDDGRILVGLWDHQRIQSLWNVSRGGVLQRIEVSWGPRCYQCTSSHVHGD